MFSSRSRFGHYYYPNTNTNSGSQCSKCFFVGVVLLTSAPTEDIQKTHWCLTVQSSPANGMHEFKMMLICSSRTIVYLPSSRPLKLHEKEGGARWTLLHSLFKMGTFGQETPLPLGHNTEERPGLWRLVSKEDYPLQVCNIDPT